MALGVRLRGRDSNPDYLIQSMDQPYRATSGYTETACKTALSALSAWAAYRLVSVGCGVHLGVHPHGLEPHRRPDHPNGDGALVWLAEDPTWPAWFRAAVKRSGLVAVQRENAAMEMLPPRFDDAA